MTRLCWAILLICYYSNSESTIIIKAPGESITLKCSSEGCPQSIDRYAGIYLYHKFTEQNEVYFYSSHINSKIVERSRYKGRIWKNGTPINHNITITNLTVDDSGVYICVYKESVDKSVECNVYTVFVRGVAPYPRQRELQTTAEKRHLPGGNHDHNTTEHAKGPCPRQKALLTTAEERHLPLVLIISVCSISLLFIVIFILLIIQKVKKGRRCRKKPRPSLQESNDYVYEVMMKTNVCSATAPEQSSQNPYEFD